MVREQVYFCLTLTRESLFKRNISHFGPTTLRATICSSLLSMADVKPGDVVVDPMCGGGSIPIEGKSGNSQANSVKLIRDQPGKILWRRKTDAATRAGAPDQSLTDVHAEK